ncbi:MULTISPECIES: tyrosine-type recombinase/integrase [Sinorhizobium]|uniref:tyrosine-type recombinase/integrase n=1 Tax=Sinorhizobium TaxID=28105 RepID=UPI0004874A31|nr:MULTISPECIES: tyrosine-type recombinase/integrase [Sinorhizobium]WOS67012.1 tyrosine-type recombinase/integrase [Sinorhizobium fredii GR64]
MKTYPLPIYVQRFFTQRLTAQLHASPNTIASYRDTFRLLLKYVTAQLGREPTDLQIADIDADLVGGFLSFIETTRGNGARSRNTRLSAIRSFFKYVAVNEPQLLHHCQRVLAMPSKRYEKRTINYLTRSEIEALIAAPVPSTWSGRRDRTLLLLAVQTGLRVSELINLTCGDVVLGTGAHVRCIGKGRKERATPLRKDCAKALRIWLAERAGAEPEPLFVSNRRDRLSRDAVERIVRMHAGTASRDCSTLKGKRVTPHVLRHTAAMQLLQNGVDRTVIALWLGHENIETTQMYIHADIQLKEKAMAKTKPVTASAGRYRPADELLAFLEAL